MNPESQGPRPEQAKNLEDQYESLRSENTKLRESLKELQQENERLEKLAYYDSKTQLFNLNGLRHELEQKQLGREKPARGSMLVLDIDNFKIVNDAYGHSVGDEILKAVADYLKNSVRKTDKVARWGGEEFVIVFDKTDSEGILNKLYSRKEGEETGRPRVNVPAVIEGKEVTITLSGGVTDFSLDENMDEVFKRADEALYQAKGAGRDRIMGAEENE